MYYTFFLSTTECIYMYIDACKCGICYRISRGISHGSPFLPFSLSVFDFTFHFVLQSLHMLMLNTTQLYCSSIRLLYIIHESIPRRCNIQTNVCVFLSTLFFDYAAQFRMAIFLFVFWSALPFRSIRQSTEAESHLHLHLHLASAEWDLYMGFFLCI